MNSLANGVGNEWRYTMPNINSYEDRRELVIIAIQVEDRNGYFSREAGFLLADLSFLTGIPYKTLSVTILQMEAEGDLMVERATHREAARANKLERIRLREDLR